MKKLTTRNAAMNLYCTKCSARYRIGSQEAEKWERCAQCQTESTLRVPDAERLLEWVSSAPWDRLVNFTNFIGTRGHDCDITKEFIRVFNERKWAEADRAHREAVRARKGAILTPQERKWAGVETRIKRRRTLETLRKLKSGEFERLVADLFIDQGYKARVVGGVGDRGIDVQIHKQDGSKWGVAQCKKYSASTRVSPLTVRAFCGAYTISGAKRGFLFTTGELTKNAKRTARHFPWLTIYSGVRLIEYIERIEKLIDGTLSASIDSHNTCIAG